MILWSLISMSFAATVSGYEIPKNALTRTVEGAIVKIVDSKSDYFIQIGEYAALYKFPKNKDLDKKILHSLEKNLKEKKKIKFQVESQTAHIVSIHL